jgi:PAS domain S-box-containing protein
MAFSSYFLVRNIEIKKLRQDVNKTISYTELNIRTSMLEPETMLNGISETIRLIIMDGYNADKVRDYLQDIYDYMQFGINKRILSLVGIYGVFDVFDGKFVVVSNEILFPQDYEPKSRPWYKGAIDAAGELYISEPFLDPVGRLVHLTFSRSIYDANNVFLGVICMGTELGKIQEYAVNTKFAENGFGFLLNKDRELIAHPNPAMLGAVGVGAPLFEDELVQKEFLSERVIVDYRGVKSIFYLQRLYNGWYMGVVTPEKEYYRGIINIAYILGVLGGVFAAVLSIILVSMAAGINRLNVNSRTMAHWYRSILDAVSLPITVTNKNMEWTFVNTAVENFLSVARHEIIGKKCSEWGADICNTKDCGIARLNNGYTDTYFEQFGGKFHVDVAYLYDENGEPNGYVEVVKDITEIIEITRKQSEAESANRAKSDFLARVSHEIRTPMNAILGITEIQLQNESLPQDTQDALAKVYNSGYLLLNIINDILDLSKIEAGKLELVPVNYDVASLINDAVHLNVMRYDSKPIDFIVKVDENIPSTLCGDDMRIKQILNNLLSNAFKYTDTGSITLSASVEEDKIATHIKEKQVIFTFKIQDTGQGMTDEEVDRLFDEYTRFNMQANRTTEGTGLGMTITRHLVYMMNGEISVESEAGKGSAFTVKLPQGLVDSGVLGKQLAENIMQYHMGTASRLKNAPQIIREYMPYGRVLIVDDVETNLYVARGLMAPYGLSVESALSGQEAVDKIRNGNVYDIVFMDHFMPGMDGIEAVKLIRDFGYTNPIVALTANALSGQAEMFLENNFDGFISKPIDIRQLNTALNRFVRDKYPDDVIELARQQKERIDKQNSVKKTNDAASSQLVDIFIRDAKKAIAALETILENNFRRADDPNLFVINVHAMKSALANIGEEQISDMALRLEEAGRSGEYIEAEEDTNVFIGELKKLIEKLKPEDGEENDNSQISEETLTFLRDKLAEIKKACKSFDKKTAKEALTELKARSWPSDIKEHLSAVSVALLHSEFEETVKIIDKMILI